MKPFKKAVETTQLDRLSRAFVPFDETQDPRYLEWAGEDPTDAAIPKIQGFITDVVASTRGREIASSYAVWAALYMISMVVGRDAWFIPPDGDPWLDRDFLNLYVLLVGPAGFGKSSTINLVNKILVHVNRRFYEHDSPYMRRKEHVKIADISTPEAMLGTMNRHSKDPESGKTRVFVGELNGEEKELRAHTNTSLLISELSSILGASKYNKTMSTTLLQLFDCPEMFHWNTVKRGTVRIPETYTSLLAGSTMDAMVSTVQPEALSDGFMSRMTMVYVEDYVRSRSFRFRTGLSGVQLSERLYWIAENCTGALYLSREAALMYDKWYDQFMARMNRNSSRAGYLIRNRILVLKLAALLKLSEYRKGRQIELRHLEAALRLVAYTFANVHEVIDYFGQAATGAAKKAILTILKPLRGGLQRRTLARKITRYKVELINEALYALYLSGDIRVLDDKNSEHAPEFYPTERYVFHHVKDDEDEFTVDGRETGISESGARIVSEWDSSLTDRPKGGEEQVGRVLGPKRSGSRHIFRDEGTEEESGTPRLQVLE